MDVVTDQGGLFDEPPPPAPAAPLWPCKDRCLMFHHEQPHAKATECGKRGCLKLRPAEAAKETP